MSVTAKLVRLHLVEVQIRGLTERLNTAERRLAEQNRLLTDLEARAESIRGQLRQLEATVKNDEVEAQAFEEKIQRLRTQMNAAKSNKEYSAFLTEINTLKADKALIEERELGSMQRLEELRAEATKLEAEAAERRTLRDAAKAERDQREAEIRDRLEELKRERAVAAADVPAKALSIFDQRIAAGEDDIMAPLEEHDRKRREFACGSCQVLLPLEKLNALLGRGELTACTNCGAILYVEDAVRDSVVAGFKK